ncbi:MAG: ATP-binding protein, partial [Proteobacteria bacterium]|nr:ATP-binding protein [Pseudomonadota bacterium]
SNFLSFNKEGEFLNTAINQVSGSLKHHVFREKESHIPILKGTAIYGANASGKTNFLDAINFSKNFILNNGRAEYSILAGNQNKFSNSQTSKFEYEFKISNKIFNYGFVINHLEVLEEWLFELPLGKHSSAEEKPIFIREKNNKFSQDSEIIKIVSQEKDDNFVNYSKKALENSELFLHRLEDDNIKYAKEIFDWFRKINVISPSHNISPEVLFDNDDLQQFMKDLFCKLDNNIDDVEFKGTLIQEFKEIRNLPLTWAEKIFNDLKGKKEEKSGILITSPNINFILLAKRKDKIYQQELLIKRNNKNFTLDQESRGVKRLCTLIPILFELVKNNKIYLIDEIESSLHPILAKLLIEIFFDESKSNESQLIFTTHDSNLMDLDLLRKDEIWFVQKDKDLHTNIYSLAEFKMRADYKNIKEGYLQGRFGAIPFLGNTKKLMS